MPKNVAHNATPVLAGSVNVVGTDTVAGSLSIEDGAKVAVAAGEFGYIAGDNLVVNGGTIEVADTAGLGVSKMIATTGKFANLAGTGLEITNTALPIKSTDTKTGLLHVEGDALRYRLFLHRQRHQAGSARVVADGQQAEGA